MVTIPFDPHIVCCVLCLMVEIVKAIPICCNWRRHFQFIIGLCPRNGHNGYQVNWEWKELILTGLFTAQNASFKSLLQIVSFSLTHFIKKLTITYFFFRGKVSSWHVWNRDDLFSLMCRAIIACCKVSGPAALHGSFVKLEKCCWPGASCPYTQLVCIRITNLCLIDFTDLFLLPRYGQVAGS